MNDDPKDNVSIKPVNIISWLTVSFPYPIENAKKCMILLE